jgi:hypothetical protein
MRCVLRLQVNEAVPSYHAAKVAPFIVEAGAAGARTLREIAAALNARGVATALGGLWEAQTVANVLRHL